MNVLKIWIDKHFEDFEADPDLNGILVSFVSNRQIHETSSKFFSSFLFPLLTN